MGLFTRPTKQMYPMCLIRNEIRILEEMRSTMCAFAIFFGHLEQNPASK